MSENEKKFVPGQVVRLKSGGPLMTVNGVDDDEPDWIDCTYFTAKDEIADANFPAASLEEVAAENVEAHRALLAKAEEARVSAMVDGAALLKAILPYADDVVGLLKSLGAAASKAGPSS